MKNLLYYLFIFMTCIAISCSKEDIGETIPETGGEGEPDGEVIPDNPENVITTPCDFDLSNVAANSTIILNCVLDLNKETITLPQNVNFEFEGGDIIGNGKLIFSGGTIDGRLLSDQLQLEGDVKLKDPTFKFYSVRWGIVEGKTTSDIALENNQKLENLMFWTKELGATTFQIGKFDAYFEVTKITPPAITTFRASKEGINIPSNFTLEMADNTNLRTFPAEAGVENGAIIAINDVDNVVVKGGKLYGDRNVRAYSPDDSGLEGSHLMHIQSGRNVTIDGVKFIEGSKGGLTVYSKGFSTNPADYKPTTGVVIKNCTFQDNRRMAMSLTDCRDVLIEGNTFINSGQPMANSDGGEVGYAINVEPARRRDADTGELLELQKAFDIIIRKNTETNSRGGFVTVTIGQNITVEDNDIDSRVVYSLTNGTKILNNRFNAAGAAKDSWAIFTAGGGETVFNNEVGGNTISGYTTGIVVSSNEAYVHDNTISNGAVGIQLSKPNDTRVINNKVDVAEKGITATNTFINNGEIRGNEVTTASGGFHVYFTGVNQTDESKDYKATLVGNTFFNANKITLSRAKGITFTDNQLIGGIEIGNSNDIEISNNKKIQPNDSDGIRLFGANTNVSLLNNTISEPTGAARYVCINNNSDNPAAITDTGNTCSN